MAIAIHCSKTCFITWLQKNTILIATIIAIICGTVLGISLRPFRESYDMVAWIYIWGEIFLRMLKMIVLPLVMSCLIVGLCSVESGAGGRLGGVTLAYIFLTQILGTIIGIVSAVLLKPGNLMGDTLPQDAGEATSYTDVFTDFLRNIFPDNVVRACLQNIYTDRTVVDPTNSSTFNASLNNENFSGSIEYERKLVYRDGMNTIGVVVISVFLGFGIKAAGEQGQPLLNFFISLNAVVFKIMKVVIWYSPVGILSLIATSLLKVDDLFGALQSLGMFVMVNIVGCAALEFIFLPLIYLAVVRKNPFKFYVHIVDGVLGGIGPPSSVAGLPYLLESLPNGAKVNPSVAKFFLPIAVTINRDASAMFICICTIFVAQTYGISLPVGSMFVLGLMVVLLSSAVAAVPSSSIFVLLLVSSTLNLPVSDRLGLIMAVEWLNDRLRTCGNLTSTGYGCGIVDHICQNWMKKQDNGLRLHLNRADDKDIVNIENEPKSPELSQLIRDGSVQNSNV